MVEDNILAAAQRHHQVGQTALAETAYRELLALDPQNPAGLYGMAVLAYQSGRLGDAAVYADRLAKVAPRSAQAHYVLATVWKAQGDIAGAIDKFLLAAACDPANPLIHSTLGAAFRDQGNFAKAIESYLKVVALRPADESAWSHLANVYWQAERFEDATGAFRKAVTLRPDQAHTHQNLGQALFEQGDYEAALECYRKAVMIAPAHGTLVQYRTLIPVILKSEEQIDEVRDRLDHNLDAMLQEPLHLSNPVAQIGRTNFFLAYQGRNDRALQVKIGELYRRICPSLYTTAAHCSSQHHGRESNKIRVGFISKFFKNHSIGRTSRGIIEHLSRDRFEVVAIFLDPPVDETAVAIARAADDVLVIANDLDPAREAIAEKRLDILFYQDIGMDVFTYFLAFARLAPVQCASFGHPVTTGIPTIDYYISTDFWEPEDGLAHYSEKLVCLKDVGSVAYYYKPDVPDPLKPRSHFALRDDEHIYICPQALFKMHPEFDCMLGAILRRDPAGKVVLVDGRYKRWSELLRDRFRRTIPDIADRIQFLPRQRSIDFINLIAVADVMLDTPHFCGFNTTLEAFAVGVPVITLPGQFMRSRHTAAFYRKMSIPECIAGNTDDYVDKAVRMGTDPEWRDEICEKIRLGSPSIWEEAAVIREFERLFEAMNAQAI